MPVRAAARLLPEPAFVASARPAMTLRGRRPIGFREAAEILEHHHGRPFQLGAVFRLIHILWWRVVGKPRFVPPDRTDQVVRAEKKRTRQQRRRARRGHR